MKNHNVKDLTEGSIFKLLLGFTIPVLLGYLFQQFYSMIDTIVVGKFLGVDALAGVGSTGAINFLVLGFCTGICSGFAIPVAQKFGEKNYPGLRRIVGNILWLSIGFSIAITLLVCLLCRHLLHWMNTPPETFSYAYTYIFIIFLGIPSMIFYNVLSGIIRSLGDSRTPLVFLVFSSVLNIILDLVLILWVRMGVAGAAVATVTSQVVSGVLCFFYMLRKYPLLRLSREDMKLRRYESGLLLSMGVPMGLQYTITAVGSTILQTAVNTLGSSAMAAVTAGSRCMAFLATPFDAIGTAAATFTGQNLGAGKLDRIRRSTLISFLMGSAYSIAALVFVWFWGKPMVMLFLDPGSGRVDQLLGYSQRFLLASISFFIPLLCVNLFRFTIQGMGYSNLALLAGGLELAGRAILAIALVPIFGFDAVCLANAAAWVLADLFLIPMYFIGLRSLKKRMQL